MLRVIEYDKSKACRVSFTSLSYRVSKKTKVVEFDLFYILSSIINPRVIEYVWFKMFIEYGLIPGHIEYYLRVFAEYVLYQDLVEYVAFLLGPFEYHNT